MEVDGGNKMKLPVSVQRINPRLLQLRYTRTVKIGNAWNTYLQINHQGFCVVEQTSKHRALWFGKNLAIALDRMLTHFEPSLSFPISNRKTKCPQCDGNDNALLGALGNVTWVRCRCCGADHALVNKDLQIEPLTAGR